MSQVDLFKNYLYLIGSCVKKFLKNLLNYTKNVNIDVPRGIKWPLMVDMSFKKRNCMFELQTAKCLQSATYFCHLSH